MTVSRKEAEAKQRTEQHGVEMREQVPSPPRGRERWRWYGPGLLWMVSSVGSGSVLFTPRIGSRYGYELLWAALIIIFLMWVMIREVGRYTVVTGKTILDGYRDLPGPRGWAIWFILLPQLVSGVITIAGIAALAGSALMLNLPGGQVPYAIGLIVVSGVLVVSGRYSGVERISQVTAALIVAAALAAAIRVFPNFGAFAGGVVPGIPQNFDLYFALPWLGFILAGAAGIMWFSYWVSARGYGGEVNGKPDEDIDDQQGRERRIERLRDWMRIMSTTALIGVVGGGIVILAFLVLGAELLGPRGIVPQGIDVAEQLTRLLSEVWGAFGYWLLLVGIIVVLWSTVLADQDGWARMYADATRILAGVGERDKDRQRGGLLGRLLRDRDRLKNIFVLALLTAAPVVILLLVRDPVAILSVGGIVTAMHTPVIVALTLYLNRTVLPEEMRPNLWWSGTMIASALFFTVFAVLYLLQLVGVIGGSSQGDAATNTAPGVTVQSILQNPRGYIDGQVIVRGAVGEVLGEGAFTLTAPQASAGERLLVLIAPDSGLPSDLNGPATHVFEGEAAQVAGPLIVFDLDRVEAALSVDLDDVRLAEFAGEPALLGVVVQAPLEGNEGGQP